MVPERSSIWCTERRCAGLLAGESVDEIAFLLGHSNANVTRTVYLREISDGRRRARRRSYEEVVYELEEVCDLGQGVTYTRILNRARLSDSAGWVQLRFAPVATWEDGLIQRQTEYLDVDEARAQAEQLAEKRRQDVRRGSLDLSYRLVDAMNARQVPEFLASDVRVETPETAVTGGTLVGEQGWRQWMSEFFGVFGKDARMQVDEIVASGEDFVAAVVSLVGTGAASEIPLTLRWANVWWFRNGQLVRVAGFLHRREALDALGLES